MERLIQSGKNYTYHEYATEKELEQIIVHQVNHIFGYNSVYTDIKKRVGKVLSPFP